MGYGYIGFYVLLNGFDYLVCSIFVLVKLRFFVLEYGWCGVGLVVNYIGYVIECGGV